MTDRIVLAEPAPGVRVVLETDHPEPPLIVQAMLMRIDNVRTLLVRGEVSPDMAWALLLGPRLAKAWAADADRRIAARADAP